MSKRWYKFKQRCTNSVESFCLLKFFPFRFRYISFAGGIRSKAGVHPWQASVRVRGKDKTYHWCGAVIISRHHVLTAAHCLREFPVATYIVRVGDYALGNYGYLSSLDM